MASPFFTSFIQTLKGILTTKGDILGFGTTETRLAVGANDTILTADSAEALGIKWATPAPSLVFARIIKKADESIQSTTTLQDDDELTVAISASTNYFVVVYLFLTSASNADLKYAFSVPSSPTDSMKILSGDWSCITDQNALPITTVQSITTTGSDVTVQVFGTLINGATAGNLVFQWAQTTSQASDTTVLRGSTMIVYEATQ